MSHSSKDHKLIKELDAALREVFKDRYSTDHEYNKGANTVDRAKEIIKSEIEDSNIMIVMFTENWLHSENCLDELRDYRKIELDKDHNKRLIIHILFKDDMDRIFKVMFDKKERIAECIQLYMHSGSVSEKAKKVANQIRDMVDDNEELEEVDIPEGYVTSCNLPKQRIAEISNSLKTNLPQLRKLRKAHTQKKKNIPKTQPAWYSISSTTSDSGKRLVMGFSHVHCKYRGNDDLKLGCYSCGFYAGAGQGSAGVASYSEQFAQTIRQTYFISDYDVIEFLSDGSFLSQVPNTREQREYIDDIFRNHISRYPRIKRVLIEERPDELLKDSAINFKLLTDIVKNKLNENQTLEVGMGLECQDDYVREACINKGFSKKEFEDAIKKIKEISYECKGRISPLAYILVKPPFLTEREAIDEALRTLQYLKKLSDYENIEIIPKLEPTVISKGTMQEVLFTNDEYTPLNYWSILEIITWYSLNMPDSKLRIGAREDMDEVIKVPAIYKGGRFDKLDFVVYGLIQDFNKTNDIDTLYISLIGVILRVSTEAGSSCDPQEYTPSELFNLEEMDSYLLWEKSVGCSVTRKTAIREYIESFESFCLDEEIAFHESSANGVFGVSSFNMDHFSLDKIEFYKKAFDALDWIEGQKPGSRRAPLEIIEKYNRLISESDDQNEQRGKTSHLNGSRTDGWESMQCLIQNAFENKGNLKGFVKLRDATLEREKHLRLFFDVYDYETSKVYTMWSLLQQDVK